MENSSSTEIEGRLADTVTYLRALQQSSAPDAFLVIDVLGTEDFLQFIPSPDGLNLDFPLLTPRQRALEAKLRRTAASLGLAVRRNEGGDGSAFLDVELSGGAATAARVVERLLVDLYGINAQTRLLFVCQGCSLAE